MSLKSVSKIGINITKNAWNKMENIMKYSKNKSGFIFSASSGGCNGFNFNLELLDDKKLNNFNNIKPNYLKNNTTKVYIDPLSEMYLIGTTIDYVYEDYTKGQFENKFVFNVDSKLMSSCGCGISFSPKKY